MLNKTENITNKSVAYKGGELAVAGVFGYSLVVMLYAIIRSSLTIYNIIPSGERTDILINNGFSIAYSVAVFSILMALLAFISGAIAAIILKNALQYFNPNYNIRKAIVISCITAFATLVTMYLLLYALLKNWMTCNYMETFSFWFLLPAAIYVGACIIGGEKLNRILNKGLAVLKF